MSQDLLDRQQVDACFQQFRGKGVTQRVGRHAGREPRPAHGLPAGYLHRRRVERATRPIAGEQPLRVAVLAPPLPQFLEQGRRERHQPLLVPFAPRDPDGHLRAVDVGHAQVNGFAHPQPGGIDRGQQDAVAATTDTFEQFQCLGLTEHLGNRLGQAAIGEAGEHFGPTQRGAIEKT